MYENIMYFSTTYSYNYTDSNWKDKMTLYNGSSITYDAIGNPIDFNGKRYTWDSGRQLNEIYNNNGTPGFISDDTLLYSYKYNAEGIRTQKTINSVVTDYVLEGDRVIYEKNGTDTIWYFYDGSGQRVCFKLNGTFYYYVYNLQGDVVSIINNTGSIVAAYTYDSWGKLISIKDDRENDITNITSSVGYKNPYRYRGYRYDNETGLYYLQSRYYNPEVGRFLNADGLVSTEQGLLAHNMFTYCNNNRVPR